MKNCTQRDSSWRPVFGQMDGLSWAIFKNASTVDIHNMHLKFKRR